MSRTPILDLAHRPAAGADPFAFFADVVDRLESVVQAETDGLRANRPIDLGDINRQKQQAMLELRRLMPRLAGMTDPSLVQDRLGRLHGTLEQNRTAIDIQLRAVREIADIIAETMKEAESDGTYSRGFGAF